jgi:4'-phosphopantetheinyl transferase
MAVDAGHLKIVDRTDGKPQLAPSDHHHAVRFNLTHSAGLALFAIAQHSETGIDVEVVRDIPDADRIVKWNFSRLEQIIWTTIPESDRNLTFLQCWTRKEACVKACGTGLSASLSNFSVSFGSDDAEVVEVEGNRSEAERWTRGNAGQALSFEAAVPCGRCPPPPITPVEHST